MRKSENDYGQGYIMFVETTEKGNVTDKERSQIGENLGFEHTTIGSLQLRHTTLHSYKFEPLTFFSEYCILVVKYVDLYH